MLGLPFASDNEKAPTHRVYAKSPRGHDIEVGGIWKKENQDGKPYYTLSIRTTTPISAGSPARTTRPCRRSSNGNPAINPLTAPGC